MNPARQTVSHAELPILPVLPSLPIAVALVTFLTAMPFAAAAANAQSLSLREAGQAAVAVAAEAGAQSKSCVAKAQDWLKECEEEERDDEDDDGVPDRTGLGWTGIGLASAGAVQTAIGLTVSRWRNCGPANRNHCENLERAYRITGGTLLGTGLTFLLIDETRRHRKPRPSRQTVVDIGPRAIQVRVLF
jgi:hypothetical protein